MKTLITAIDNSEVNRILKKQENIKIACKDISYKEGIIEQIEKNKKIDLIIMDEKIDGEILLNELIRKIKEKIRNVEIIIITERKKEIQDEICRFKNIKIYETNKIKIKKLLQLVNTEEKEYKEMKIKQKELISITGAEGVGKSITSIIFSKLNTSTSNLIIDFNNMDNQDISIFLGLKNKNTIQEKNEKLSFISTNKITNIKKIINKNNFENIIIDLGNKIKKEEKEFILKKSKIILLIEPNLIGIKKGERIIKYYLENLNINKNKILILLNKKNKYSINKEIIKNIFKEIKIIGEIKNNIEYEKLINNKFNNIKLLLNKKERVNILKIIENVNQNTTMQ